MSRSINDYRLKDESNSLTNDPVIDVTMQNVTTLLLDEIDLTSNKIMCLQPILVNKISSLLKRLTSL